MSLKINKIILLKFKKILKETLKDEIEEIKDILDNSIIILKLNDIEEIFDKIKEKIQEEIFDKINEKIKEKIFDKMKSKIEEETFYVIKPKVLKEICNKTIQDPILDYNFELDDSESE